MKEEPQYTPIRLTRAEKAAVCESLRMSANLSTAAGRILATDLADRIESEFDFESPSQKATPADPAKFLAQVEEVYKVASNVPLANPQKWLVTRLEEILEIDHDMDDTEDEVSK